MAGRPGPGSQLLATAMEGEHAGLPGQGGCRAATCLACVRACAQARVRARRAVPPPHHPHHPLARLPRVTTLTRTANSLPTAVSVAYTAPEALANPWEPRTTSGDVFSFGLLLLELCTRQPLYPGTPAAVIIGTVCKGERPPVPGGVPGCLRDIVEGCWAQEPAARPAFGNVAACLRLALAKELRGK